VFSDIFENRAVQVGAQWSVIGGGAFVFWTWDSYKWLYGGVGVTVAISVAFLICRTTVRRKALVREARAKRETLNSPVQRPQVKLDTIDEDFRAMQMSEELKKERETTGRGKRPCEKCGVPVMHKATGEVWSSHVCKTEFAAT
jgi:hypothetical protein